MTFDVLLANGSIVDGSGAEPFRADLGIRGNRITAIAPHLRDPTAVLIDCEGRYLLPGFLDAHSHADGAVFDPEVMLAQLRQGVTTLILGQDGVSFAPGDGRYATDYFGAINGRHPNYPGHRVADLLATYDNASALNVAYLVPHGTVRYEVMAFAQRPPTEDELARMTHLVRQGMADGAVGMSTGLDYIPGLFADATELGELCEPVAAAGGLYVTHMRGGYESNAGIGVEEIRAICQQSGVAAHISHYHGPAALLTGLVDDALAAGVDLTFDSYPYRRGFTLLSMPMLPPELLRLGPAAAARELTDPAVREGVAGGWLPRVAARPDMGDDWADRATIAHVAAEEYGWVVGRTLTEAARQAGLDPGEFGLRLLAAAGLEVTAIFALPASRGVADIRMLLRHPAQLAGSDGIFTGGHPHPRAWGTFARLLGRHTREWGDYSWGEVARHAAGNTAARFGVRHRGMLRVGWYADVAVIDPARVVDEADYDDPRQCASGVDDVMVNGTVVLRHGELTGATPGRAIRRRRD